MQCPFTASAPNEAQLLPKIQSHAAAAHNMKTIDPKMMAQIKSVIKM